MNALVVKPQDMSSKTESYSTKVYSHIAFENMQIRQKKLMYWIEEEYEGEWYAMSQTITNDKLKCRKALQLNRMNKTKTFRMVHQWCMVTIEGVGRKFNTTTRDRINKGQ